MILLNGAEVIFEKFPNGETKMIHESILENLEDDNKVEFKYTEDGDLIKLMFFKKYIDEHCTCNMYLLVYYMPYSRMDRSEDYSPFTLKYVTKFINDLDFKTVSVIEPHSDVTVALLDRGYANYDNFDYVEDVKEMVDFDNETDYIVFPDAGAQKRYAKMKARNVLIGHKHRDFTNGQIQSLELVGSVVHKPNKAIIVDDLSSFGGTFIQTADVLRELGFKEVYLLVAHAENNIFKRNERTGKLLFEHVDKIFTTDSILTEQNYPHNLKFKDQLHIFEIAPQTNFE